MLAFWLIASYEAKIWPSGVVWFGEVLHMTELDNRDRTEINKYESVDGGYGYKCQLVQSKLQSIERFYYIPFVYQTYISIISFGFNFIAL